MTTEHTGLDLSELALIDAAASIPTGLRLWIDPTTFSVPPAFTRLRQELAARETWRQCYRAARQAKQAQLLFMLDAAKDLVK